jgi:sialic acid synthase SpsE
MRKQVRDLRRVDEALGEGKKMICPYEVEFRAKLGKSLYTKTALKAGHVMMKSDVLIKAPGGGIPPLGLAKIIGKKLMKDVAEEYLLTESDLQ